LVIAQQRQEAALNAKSRRIVGEGWHSDFRLFAIRQNSDFDRNTFFGLMGSDAIAPMEEAS